MRKERIVAAVSRRFYSAISHNLLNSQFARKAEEVSSYSLTPRLVPRADTSMEDLSCLEVAEGRFSEVLRIRHCLLLNPNAYILTACPVYCPRRQTPGTVLIPCCTFTASMVRSRFA